MQVPKIVLLAFRQIGYLLDKILLMLKLAQQVAALHSLDSMIMPYRRVAFRLREPTVCRGRVSNKDITFFYSFWLKNDFFASPP